MSMLVVIPCSAEKTKVPCAAEQLYLGQFYKLALRSARALVDDEQIRILSGKHGLLRLTDELWPYEQRIDAPGAVEPATLVEQLAGCVGVTQIVSLCPKSYTEALRSPASQLGLVLRAPLAGSTGIGVMRQRLADIARREQL